MTLFLGCDVSKAKLDVSLIDERGVELWYDRVPNDAEPLLGYLLTVAGGYPNDEVQCVVEATSLLHVPLCEACVALGIPCLVYNPILTKQQVRMSVRGRKTDRTDAILIARIGLMGQAKPYVPDRCKAVKYYTRGSEKLGQVAMSLKLYEAHLTTALDEELTAAARSLLADIQQACQAARQQFIADSVAAVPPELMTQLKSIPGVGPYVAASLIGEIQDMSRFPSAKALVAYVGLDPKIRQSGTALNSTDRLTKRGSPHLRRTLFLAANVARQHDPYFRALYDKKRAEGKRHTVATCVTARALLGVIRAVWLRGTPYRVSCDQTTPAESLT